MDSTDIQNAPGPSERVLLVDDDLDSLGSIARFLRVESYEVVVAGDAATAQSRLGGGKPFDVVISDLKMPGDTGLDLCLWIRKSYPALPVILISGMAQTADIVSAMQMGALTFLEKPVDPDLLLNNLDRALGRALDPDMRQQGQGGQSALPERVKAFEATLIEDALRQSGGRVKEAMEILGVGRRTLNDKMSRLGIDRRLINDS